MAPALWREAVTCLFWEGCGGVEVSVKGERSLWQRGVTSRGLSGPLKFLAGADRLPTGSLFAVVRTEDRKTRKKEEEEGVQQSVK